MDYEMAASHFDSLVERKSADADDEELNEADTRLKIIDRVLDSYVLDRKHNQFRI